MRAKPIAESREIMATLLLTATKQVSENLATKLESLGHKAIISPLLEIVPVNFTKPNHNPEAILITSRYALEAAEIYVNTPLYIVGEQTAKLALAQGHYIARIATDVQTIEPFLPDNILYLRGRDISHELNLQSVICYQAEPLEPPKNLPDYDAIITLSARTARLLSKDINSTIFCLSNRIKSNLPAILQEQAIVAAQATEDALIKAIKYWSVPQ